MSLSVGSGCGSFGRAVASVTRRLQFESSHHKIYNEQCLPTVNCIKKTKNKEKEAGNGPNLRMFLPQE